MSDFHATEPTDWQVAAIERQLGRAPRGDFRIAATCSGDWPAVVRTPPRLPDGTPFPTLYYLTCRKMNSALSTLESEGVMVTLQNRLAEDPEFAASYLEAHRSYIAERDEIETVDQLADFSAGGMPTRVKCLHALVGHSLAVGPGVNPVGDAAIEIVVERGLWPHSDPCVERED